MKTLCQAPAKILLSGEHSVVYGAPGLSMAINLPTTCEIGCQPCDTPFIEIELVNYQQKHAFPFALWKKLAINIECRYSLYQQEISSINTVLQHPIDLILVTLDHFNQHHRLKSAHWSIKIQSHDFPSRGLGSSASVIISLLKSLYAHHHLEPTKEELLALAQTIESRQHGSSSGIDPTSILFGGLLRFQHHHPIQQLPAQNFRGWLIDTGTPKTSTGQAVEAVRKRFGYNHPIWENFQDVTNKIEQAWLQQNAEMLRQGIRINHQLLCEIGVIPQKVQDFIATLHQTPNIAAKVCGAGASSGENAGMILCISPNPPASVCLDYGYRYMPLELSEGGADCQPYTETHNG